MKFIVHSLILEALSHGPNEGIYASPSVCVSYRYGRSMIMIEGIFGGSTQQVIIFYVEMTYNPAKRTVLGKSCCQPVITMYTRTVLKSVD